MLSVAFLHNQIQEESPYIFPHLSLHVGMHSSRQIVLGSNQGWLSIEPSDLCFTINTHLHPTKFCLLEELLALKPHFLLVPLFLQPWLLFTWDLQMLYANPVE